MRWDGLDRLRGFAIALMVLDHVLAASGGGMLFRLTLTRLSLPIFLFVAGSLGASRLLRRPSFAAWYSGRFWVVLLAAAASSVLVSGLPFMAPVDVLVPIFLSISAYPILMKSGLRLDLWIAACFVAVATFPFLWPGYHPAHVLGLYLLGSRLPPDLLDHFGLAIPRLFASVGRAPLRWYLGHLVVLVLFLAVLP